MLWFTALDAAPTEIGGGVAVFLPPDQAPHERIQLSAGTAAAESVDADPTPYSGDARVPRAPWTPITAEAGVAPAAGEFPSVRLLPLPPGLRQDMRKLLRSRGDAPSAPDLPPLVADPGPLLLAAERVAQALHEGPEPVHVLGLGIHAPGRWTSTESPAAGVRIGMHLDSWDRLPFRRRHEARNRLCMNLGTQARHFLFVPKTAAAIARELGVDFEAKQGATDVVRHWLRLHPAAPVLRLRVEPGEAYIAPTEALPHDASTFESQDWDVTFTCLGRFRLN